MVDPCGMVQDIDPAIYGSDQVMDTTANVQGVDLTERVICDDFMVGFINDQSVVMPDQSVGKTEQGITPEFMGEFMAGYRHNSFIPRGS